MRLNHRPPLREWRIRAYLWRERAGPDHDRRFRKLRQNNDSLKAQRAR